MDRYEILRILRIAAAAVLLCMLSLADIRKKQLPDSLILLLAASSCLRLYAPGAAAGRILTDMLRGGAGTFFLLLLLTGLTDRALGKKTLGGGDVKLAASLGLHLGFFPALRMLLAAAVLALPEAFVRRRRGDGRFAFAPYLCAAGLAVMAAGS